MSRGHEGKNTTEIMIERFCQVMELLEHIDRKVHHMGQALVNLTAAVAENNRLIQLAVNAIGSGGTSGGEDPVAVQALVDQLVRDDRALASVLGSSGGGTGNTAGTLARVTGVSGQAPNLTLSVDNASQLREAQTLVTSGKAGSCVVQTVGVSSVTVLGTTDFSPTAGDALSLAPAAPPAFRTR